MEDINLTKVIIATVIALAILFVGNFLINDYRVEYQLREQLESLPQVKKVKVSQEQDYKLDILLGQINDLQEVNLEIREKAKKILGTANYQLQLRGVNSSNLKKIYNKINLALYESLVTGKYTKFGAEVEKYKQQYNLKKAEVKVDHSYIYLTLVDDRGALYQVLSRNKVKVGDRNG